jgi:cobaltochelatase CobS
LTLLDANRVLPRTRPSACLPPPTPLALAMPAACIMARSRSIKGRWTAGTLWTTLNYLPSAHEVRIIEAKVPELLKASDGKKLIASMVRMAGLTRAGFINGDLSTVMSPRTVITWAQNTQIFGDAHFAFRLSFLNKCDETERPTVAEYYQRCFGVDLLKPLVDAAEV